MRSNKKPPLKSDKSQAIRGHKRGVVGYSRKTALLEEAITQMNAGKYGRSSAALKELLALDPHNMEARRLFATLHLRLGSLIPARQAFDSLISEAFQRQDYWLAESLLREYLAAGPRCVPFLEKLGALYQEKGDALEAVAEYGKAIDILIEDPDPDNPQHASQLYAKIRELAPASPVSFRLASFFDAQTGEVLARQPIDSGQSIVAPSLDMPEGCQDIPAGPELMDGVMPWEIQDSPPPPDSLNPADLFESSASLIPPVITDLSADQVPTFDGESAPADPPLEQTASSGSEVRGGPTEHSETQPGPDPALSIDTPAAVQEQDRLLAEVEPEAACDESGSSTNSESTEPPTAPQSPISVAQSIEDTSVMSSSQIEEIAEPAFLRTESSTDGPMEAEDRPPCLPQPVETDSKEVVTEQSSDTPAPLSPEPVSAEAEDPHPSLLQPVETDSREVVTEQSSGTPAPASPEPVSAEANDPLPSLLQPVETDSTQVVTEQLPSTGAQSSPELVSTNEISEPWRQPGFSWESVFNSAWKFGSDRSAPVSPSEFTQTSVEEAPRPAPAAAPPQEQVLENQAVEIPEREESRSLADQTSSGSPIAPMPWDQVQESVISISPAQAADPSMTESRKPAVERTLDPGEPRVTPQVGEDQAQLPPSPDVFAAETDSFSIAQTPQAPVLPEPEVSAVDLGQASFPTEKDPIFVEPEPQLPVVSAPMMDESPPSEDAPATIVSPVLAHGPVAAEMMSPSECPPQTADPGLSTDDDPAIAAAQSPIQESTAEPPVAPSQPTSETLNGETHEIPLPSPLLKPASIWEPPPEITAIPDPAGGTAEVQDHERHPWDTAFVEEPTPIPEPIPEPEEWVQAGEAIRFIESPQTSPIAHVPSSISERQDVSRSMSVAAAAVDVLFESSRNVRASETRESMAESKPSRKSSSALVRARLAIAGFVSLCFSTTRAIVMTCVGLVMLLGVFIASAIGAIGLTWIIMEESPSPVFQSLTTTPQRTLSDYKKNGYFLLLGIDASVGHDPIQAGYDRKSDANDGKLALACFGGSGSRMIEGSNASANVMRGWFRSSDPVGQFKSHPDSIQGWGDQHQPALNRYGQWQKLPFEDWGYGQTVSPPCTAMVFAHQLHVADGFLQGADLGVDRLETDMEAWRIVLSQAKTLAVKMLALQAINDDIAVASGLLVRSDFDGKYLRRVTTFLRPLDQGELSMRWPMQSELVAASKTYKTQLRAAKAEEQPVYTMVASALPLPMQRRLNDYAEYYDASYKAAGEGQYGSLPKWKHYIRFPASGLMDYLTNPIENIVGLEPLAPWDLYNGFVVDTEARLRLAGLQAWLRRGSADGDLVTRIAKAGQSLYDPYTGLPMLMNMKKSALYSVGHDGKDQDADPQADVVVEIPALQTSAAPAKPSAASSKSR